MHACVYVCSFVHLFVQVYVRVRVRFACMCIRDGLNEGSGHVVWYDDRRKKHNVRPCKIHAVTQHHDLSCMYTYALFLCLLH